MNHVPRQQPQPPQTLPVRLQLLALELMDAAELTEEQGEEAGRCAALEVAERVRQLVTSPTA